jgi:hypothetical protein
MFVMAQAEIDTVTASFDAIGAGCSRDSPNSANAARQSALILAVDEDQSVTSRYINALGPEKMRHQPPGALALHDRFLAKDRTTPLERCCARRLTMPTATQGYASLFESEYWGILADCSLGCMRC